MYFFCSRTPSSVTSAINSLSSNVSLSQEEKKRVIEDEAKTLEQFKVRLEFLKGGGVVGEGGGPIWSSLLLIRRTHYLHV